MKNNTMQSLIVYAMLLFLIVSVVVLSVDWKKAVGITAGVVGGVALAGAGAYAAKKVYDSNNIGAPTNVKLGTQINQESLIPIKGNEEKLKVYTDNVNRTLMQGGSLDSVESVVTTAQQKTVSDRKQVRDRGAENVKQTIKKSVGVASKYI